MLLEFHGGGQQSPMHRALPSGQVRPRAPRRGSMTVFGNLPTSAGALQLSGLTDRPQRRECAAPMKSPSSHARLDHATRWRCYTSCTAYRESRSSPARGRTTACRLISSTGQVNARFATTRHARQCRQREFTRGSDLDQAGADAGASPRRRQRPPLRARESRHAAFYDARRLPHTGDRDALWNAPIGPTPRRDHRASKHALARSRTDRAARDVLNRRTDVPAPAQQCAARAVATDLARSHRRLRKNRSGICRPVPAIRRTDASDWLAHTSRAQQAGHPFSRRRCRDSQTFHCCLRMHFAA